jgi:hypothetical protein
MVFSIESSLIAVRMTAFRLVELFYYDKFLSYIRLIYSKF